MRSLRGRFHRLGLQRRIMLYVTAGLVVFSAIYGWVALQAIQQSTELVYRERLLVARTLAREIEDALLHVQGEIEAASASIAPALAANNLPATEASLRTLYDHWTSSHRFENPCTLVLTDTQGRVLWSEPGPAYTSRTFAPLSSLQNDLSAARALITEGIASDGTALPSDARSRKTMEGAGSEPRRDGASSLVLTAPIRANAQTLGFLVGEINRSHIGRPLQSTLDVGSDGYAVELLDGAGLVIATNEKGKQFSTSPHLKLITSDLQAEQAGVQTHTFRFDGAERSHVIAFAPLTQIGWGVVVEQEVDQALLLPRSLQTQFLAFGIVALVGGLALAWVTTRAVVRPVNTLIDASQTIARGDLDHALDVSGEDEVGVLARTFDEMRVELKRSREEIARWNRELEARVAQRTRELTALVASSHALTSTLELDALFQILMRETRDVLPSAEGIALFLRNELPGNESTSQLLRVRSTFGFDAGECMQLRFRVGEAIAGKVFETQTPVLLKTRAEVQAAQANFSSENRTHFRRAVGERQVQSAVGVPLFSKGECLGALMLYNFARESAFAQSDVPVLQALANQAAAALENARLYQEASEVGALRELNRLKSEFVARASHELRTPLTAIKSLAETLLRHDLALDAAIQTEFLQGIDAASDRLSKIVEQLLTLSRVEAGKLEIHRERVDVAALIARVVAQFRAQFPDRPISLSIAEDVPPVMGDAERVEDVLTNLLSNALKYSDAATPVEIRAYVGEGRVVIAVVDMGIGIPPEAREKIFERFYRVDNPVTRRVGGAGLGLHICKTYVEAMGGAIQVESNNGCGSVFCFTLPRANDED